MESFWDITLYDGISVLTIIFSVALSLICSVIYLKFKTQGEKKADYEKTIGDKIASASTTVRDLELSLKAIEIFNIEDVIESGNSVDFFEFEEVTYPAIMASPECFFDFLGKVSKARTDCEEYLNYNAAALLYYTERYCMSVSGYAAQNSIPLNILGTMLIRDLHELQQQFDFELVKLINKPQCKIYSHNGPKWDKAKKKVKKQLWETSILGRLINNDESPEIKAVRAILFKDPNAEELVNQLK